MTCREARIQIQTWLDAALESSLARALEDHLADCDTCRQEADALRALTETLSQEGLLRPSPELTARLLRQLAARRFRPATPRWAEALTLVGAAAAGASLAVIGLPAAAHSLGLTLTTPMTIVGLAAAGALGMVGASAWYYQA